MRPSPTSPPRSRTLLTLAAVGLLLAAALWVRPLSVWLGDLTPDRSLEPRTAQFLDVLRWFVLGGGVVLLACGLRADLARTLATAWTEPAPGGPPAGRSLAPVWGALALSLRLGIAAIGDTGLGDDGARVAWLESWLGDPRPVWSGMWLPGHLYLHALANLVVRDAVWSGVLLSAVAIGAATWMLARGVERDWGRGAGAAAGCAMALLPVSMAHGATPDVNPVFAGCAVGACAALQRGVRTRRTGWLVASWACIALATWMRFEGLALVPGLALLLWPRWRALVLFGAACVLPTVLWNAVEVGQTSQVLGVMQHDPTLGGSLVSVGFTGLGALWQAVTLPWLLLGMAGMIRAWRARRGRAWMPLALLHAAALAGTMVVLRAGTQPRYFILVGTVLAAYAGVALGGILAASRRAGLAIAALAAVLVIVAPPLYPGGRDLWMRRDPQLRALVDEVASRADGRDVVWVSEESGFFYACRKRPPVDRFHSMPRHDSDPARLLGALDHADAAIACVQELPLPRARWENFLALAAAEWETRPLARRDGYALYALSRLPEPESSQEEGR